MNIGKQWSLTSYQFMSNKFVLTLIDFPYKSWKASTKAFFHKLIWCSPTGFYSLCNLWALTKLFLSGILIKFIFLFPATNFDGISGMLIIFQKLSSLSPQSSPLSNLFEVDKHIQKLLCGRHTDTFTAVRLHRKEYEKLGCDEKNGTKGFSNAFFFFLFFTRPTCNK